MISCIHCSLQWGSQWSLSSSASHCSCLSTEEITSVPCSHLFWTWNRVWNPCFNLQNKSKWYFWALHHQPVQWVPNTRISGFLPLFPQLVDSLGPYMSACPVGPEACGCSQTDHSTRSLCTMSPWCLGHNWLCPAQHPPERSPCSRMPITATSKPHVHQHVGHTVSRWMRAFGDIRAQGHFM